MEQNRASEERLRELFDADAPADELRRLARVDGLLRAAVRLDDEEAAARRLERARASISAARHDEQPNVLRLSFDELAVIYKSLQAAKTLGVLPPEDEFLDDTMELVDQALKNVI